MSQCAFHLLYPSNPPPAPPRQARGQHIPLPLPQCSLFCLVQVPLFSLFLNRFSSPPALLIIGREQRDLSTWYFSLSRFGNQFRGSSFVTARSAGPAHQKPKKSHDREERCYLPVNLKSCAAYNAKGPICMCWFCGVESWHFTPLPTVRAVNTHIGKSPLADCGSMPGGWFGRERSRAGDKSHRCHGGRYRRCWACA